VPPDTTVADFVDVAGELFVGVVVVAVVADVDAVLPELDEPCDVALAVDPVPDVVGGVELTVVLATVAVPGISFETTSPSTVADPAATIATVLDMRQTFVAATSRRLASSWPRRDSDPLARPLGGSLLGGVLMDGMSPCEPRDPRTVG
jgi:hypothetical protein